MNQQHFGFPHSAHARLGLILCFLILCVACTRQSNEHHAKASSTVSQSPKTDAADPSSDFRATPFEHSLPLGLPEYHVRADNPMTQEKVALGRKLFFDNELSLDRTMSCATCHDPRQGWSNNTRFAIGVNGQQGQRNVPTIVNTAYYRALFWDGRAGSLEGQALGPIMNKDEMGMPSAKVLVDRLREHSEYPELFAVAFQDGLSATNVAKAIACL